MARSLSFTHILQIDFVKEPGKTIAIVEIDIISALAIPLSSDFPKMWVKDRARSQGLLRSPRGGTYPHWLAWDTSCPSWFLLRVSCQNVDGRILVPIQDQPTVRTRMHPHVQILLDDATTPATRLAGILGGDAHHLATSLFRFVATQCDELSPTSDRVGSQRGTDFCF